jgi:hypothetical protein
MENVNNLLQDGSLKSVDMSENLKLYHLKDDTVKGIITDHNENKIIGNFSIPLEYVISKDTTETLNFPLEVFEAIEGTLIRVFYYKENWNISTNSRIDAYVSYWSGRSSFGNQFEDYVVSITGTPLDVFLMSLDTNKKYFFILPTTGINRIGKKFVQDEPKLIYLVGVEDENGNLQCGSSLSTEEKNAWLYLNKYTLNNVSELVNLVENQKINVIRYENDKLYKYVSTEYDEYCKLRNNEPNIVYRYIELLKTDQENAKKLREFYPEFKFDMAIDKRIAIITNYIHSNYISRYVKKEYVLLPKIFFSVMKKCHQHYLDTRERITLEKVKKIIFEQDTKLIVTLIRNHSWMK